MILGLALESLHVLGKWRACFLNSHDPRAEAQQTAPPPHKSHFDSLVTELLKCVCLRWNLSVPVLPLGQRVQSGSHPAAGSLPPHFHCHLRRCSRTPAALLHCSAPPLLLHPGRPRAVTRQLPGLVTHPDSHQQLRRRHHFHHRRPPSSVHPAAPSPPSRDHPHQSRSSAAHSDLLCFSTKPSGSPLCQD